MDMNVNSASSKKTLITAHEKLVEKYERIVDLKYKVESIISKLNRYKDNGKISAESALEPCPDDQNIVDIYFGLADNMLDEIDIIVNKLEYIDNMIE